jgi:hypothetical protein
VASGESFEDELAAAADGLSLLVRRLRSLLPRPLADRQEAATTALTGLAVLSARLDGRTHASPIVAGHVVADAIAVVGADVLDSLAVSQDPVCLAELRRLVEVALDQTR